MEEEDLLINPTSFISLFIPRGNMFVYILYCLFNYKTFNDSF
jgi:hypothetical protein